MEICNDRAEGEVVVLNRLNPLKDTIAVRLTPYGGPLMVEDCGTIAKLLG